MATGTTTRLREVLAEFDRLADLDGAARAGALQRLRAERPQLHEQVAALLDADARAAAAGFLESPAVPIAGDGGDDRPGGAGLSVGPWRLQSLLGQGGMGQVWLATRDDGLHQGRAAVKMLRAFHATPHAAARFAREGELLARLTHPHIAQLLDVGITPDGSRYLVLEYVQGEHLDAWCDARHLPIEARIGLVMQACEAVAYAHANLVVHRDLKPANILVTEAGGVKLLDFGVAKLLEDDETELTRAAAAGLTPEYAAPEQVDGGPIGTAADVYALGVLLYRLLCGHRPYGATARGGAALARAIVDEAPRSMLDALGAASDRATVAAGRGTTPERLRQRLRGDLETIVAKALRKRPEERYAGVPALREDLRRHLAHEPVLARPDTPGYRARKFLRRHRLQVAALALVGASLVAGIATATWQWRHAEREAQRTRSVLKTVTELFAGLSPDQSGAAQVPVVDLLRRAFDESRRNLRGDAELQAEVARPLGLLLAYSGDMPAAAEALTLSRSHLQRAGRTESAEYVEVVFELGNVQRRLGRTDAARLLFTEVAGRAAGPGDLPLYALAQLGELEQDAGRLDEARALLTRAAGQARARHGPQHGAFLKATDALAGVARAQGRWDEARTLFAAVAAGTEGSKPVDAALARLSAGTIEVETGRYAAAVPALRASVQELSRVLGDGDTHTIYARTWLATALFHAGDDAASDAAIDAARAAAARSGEPDVRHVVQVVRARHALRRGELDPAEAMLVESLAHFEAGGAGLAPLAARSRTLLGEVALRRGRADAAALLLQPAVQAQRTLLGPTHVDRWLALVLLGAVHTQRGDAGGAGLRDEALAIVGRGLPVGHPDRTRLQAIVDVAAWRAAPSDANRAAAAAALQAYAAALTPRADVPPGPAFADKLLAAPAATGVDDLLALLRY